MTPDRYRQCLAILGRSLVAFASMRALARYLSIDNGSARRYGFGRKAIPANLAAWLEMLVAAPDRYHALDLHPFPEGWHATASADPPGPEAHAQAIRISA